MFINEKVDMRIKYTREWTYEALVRLHKLHDFKDINISEIIKKAGISRATFYRNFHSKEDIIKRKVETFFTDFYIDVFDYYKKEQPEDELFLIQSFFGKINNEIDLMNLIIASNQERIMIDGILTMLNMHTEMFYFIVKTDKITEQYTMEIVASSAWSLLSRWHKLGRKETPEQLAKMYMSAFKNVYMALFEDKSRIGE